MPFSPASRIYNTVALRRIRETIQLDPSLPWTDTLVILYPQEIEVDCPHACCLSFSAVYASFRLLCRDGIKSDLHMERLRSQLVDERAGIKKTEGKRREREGKKFGKQVQMEKLKATERSKKNMEERLKSLKRKCKHALENAKADAADADTFAGAFDIAVEDAITHRPSKCAKGPGNKKMARPACDQKSALVAKVGGQSKTPKLPRTTLIRCQGNEDMVRRQDEELREAVRGQEKANVSLPGAVNNTMYLYLVFQLVCISRHVPI
ncbi:eukaryotic rRNA processing protein EBP2-domain-containing protein [Suillus ampliporus]|nr:eukaryotic rRNA processing protein EBP2-domain-containing protein [Suillus ampliporus]